LSFVKPRLGCSKSCRHTLPS